MKLTDFLALLETSVSFNFRLSITPKGLETSSVNQTMDSAVYASLNGVSMYLGGMEIGITGDGRNLESALVDLVNELNTNAIEGATFGKSKNSAIKIPSLLEIDCKLEL